MDGLTLLSVEFGVFFLIGFIAIFVNIIVGSDRKLKPYKREIRRAVNPSLLILSAVFIVVIHIVAFFNPPSYVLEGYHVINWPYRYVDLAGYDGLFSSSWPFSILFTADIVIALLATFALAIFSSVVLFFSRKSKNRAIIVKWTKVVIATVLVFDLVILLVFVYISILADQRTIFIIVLIAFLIIIPLLFITLWRPLINRFRSTQNKKYNERMKDLTTQFNQISKSADLILDQMKFEIENHDKDIKNRAKQLSNLEDTIKEKSREEADQSSRIARLEKADPEIVKDFERVQDKRDRKGLYIALINLFVGAILGVIFYAFAHALHLLGL